MRRLRVELPSRRVVTLSAEEGLAIRPNDVPGGGARELFASGDVLLEEGGARVDVDDLALGDFHALRAIATHVGWLSEEPVVITCLNCDVELRHASCAAMALGPFTDRALSDPELDATLPFDVPHAVFEGGPAITFAPLRVRDAAPLHAALRRRSLRVTASIVRAMGIVRLGEERDPARIAAALRRVDDATWDGVTNLFLESHYPPRLFSMARCDACGARNDVDAPYAREFEHTVSEEATVAAEVAEGESTFVPFDAFDERARAVYERVVPAAARDELVFLVEGGVAACDDGGDPLLGSYLPPHPGDASTPSRAGEIAVFYRTFRAMWRDEGPYDWEAELEETIEHEFEHHLGALRGDDPMDDDEREAIDAEARRIHGEKALIRRDVAALARDVAGFWRRTWPLWLLLVLVTLALTLSAPSGN